MNADHPLLGQTVLVTGASRGLGAALALDFAGAGASVAICARDAGALEGVAARVRARGGACRATALDVRDDAAVASWVEQAGAELGAPTVLVNNASILGPRVAFAEHDTAAWRAALDINLTAAFVATRAVLPSLLRGGAGSIINVSSGAAIPPRRGWGAYGVSKHALEGFSWNLAAELRGTGVRVNVVDPGAMRTAMRADAYPDEDPGKVKSPERATAVFLWLASTASAEVTGQRFRADDWPPR